MPTINSNTSSAPNVTAPASPATAAPQDANTAPPRNDVFETVSSNPFTPGPVAASVGETDTYNDVRNIVPNAELRFDRLPTEGQADREPWSGYYWPKNKGGLSYRWQTGESHTYESPSRAEVMQMSEAEIAKLSPAEKYDLLSGNYEFPLNNHMKSGNTATTPSWHGYCHGWTPASIHFEEPKPVVLENADGVRIPFASSDIKALLTYHQGDVVSTLYGRSTHPFKVDILTMGSVNPGTNARDPRAFDVNPGSFHALLGNVVGKGGAFGIDCDNGAEKWNQPLHAYRSEVLGKRAPSQGASPRATEEMVVRTDVTYTMEIEPHEQPTSVTNHQNNRSEQYLYTVELDAEGRIVGGQWLLEVEGGTMTYHQVVDELERRNISKDEIASAMPQIMRFPDYAFLDQKGEFASEFRQAQGKYAFLSGDKRKLHGYFAKLADLYEASTS